MRIVGDITKEKLDTLREADAIFREEVEKAGLDKKDYRLSTYPVAKSVSMLQMLSGGGADDSEENLTTSVENQPSLSDMFPAIARMRELKNPTIMLRMESVMEIR